jgi:hypothetical protein
VKVNGSVAALKADNSTGDEWILDSAASFIYVSIEIGLSPMILSKVKVLLDWVMTIHVILLHWIRSN